jgi:Fe-S cluster biogenesis protein NfuA
MAMGTALEERVRAAIARECREGGLVAEGDVELVRVDEDRVAQVRLGDACASCAGGMTTIVMALERAVVAEVPEIRFVEAVP